MGLGKITARMVVSSSLLLIIILTFILKYPLNLIIDALFLGLVGISSLVYILIWTFIGDKVEVTRDYLIIYTHTFPFFSNEIKRIYFKEIKFYVLNGNDIVFILKWRDMIHLDISKTRGGMTMKDLLKVLHDKKIKNIEYNQFISRFVGQRNSHLEDI